MSTGAGICDLFQQNFTEILRRIFLYLDPASLHKSRQVSPQWNSFILSSVWGSKPGLRTLQRRLHHNWLNTDPEVFSVDYTEQMFFHRQDEALALSDDCLVVGLSEVGEGGAKVIDLGTQEILTHLPHQDSWNRGVEAVVITETWIITKGEEKIIFWNRKTFQQERVWQEMREWREDFCPKIKMCAAETGDRVLYLSLHDGFTGQLILYKITPDNLQQEREKILELNFAALGTFDDTPLLASVICTFRSSHDYDYFNFSNNYFRIDEFDGDKVNTRTFEVGCPGQVLSIALSSPCLTSLHDQDKKLQMKVWNIESSTILYSIDIEPEISGSHDSLTFGRCSVVIENKLVKVTSSGSKKIYIFDGSNMEDRKSVIESKRELCLGNNVDRKILFNKLTCIYRYQDTITFMNFWR